MSSNNSNNDNDNVDNHAPQQQEQKQQPLALPDPSTASSGAHQIDLSKDGGSAVKLDHLGPMVVNTDGTMSRISNWEQMSEMERQRTLRVLGKRNKQRMDALKAKAAEDGL